MSEMLIFKIIFFGICFFLGIVFLILGIAINNNRKKKEKRCTLKTCGKVINVVKHNNYDNSQEIRTSSWYPVIEYRIGENIIKAESHYGNIKPQYKIGQEVQIYYNPQNYNEYYIEGNKVQTTISKIFMGVGIAALGISIFSSLLI